MRLRLPSPALVVAVLALLVALGGTSYAAATKLLPKNSVGSAQVVNGSLQTVDLSRKAITSLRGQRGPQGPAGVQGATGPQGAAGAQGPTGAQGPQGPKGDKGDKGDIGPSNGFETYFCASGFESNCTDDPVAITASTAGTTTPYLSLDLAAGSYIIAAQVTVAADTAVASDWRVVCRAQTVSSDPGYVGEAAATVGDAAGDSQEASIPVTFGAALSAADSIAVGCWRAAGSGAAGTGADPSVIYTDITAIQVGSFNLQ